MAASTAALADEALPPLVVDVLVRPLQESFDRLEQEFRANLRSDANLGNRIRQQPNLARLVSEQSALEAELRELLERDPALETAVLPDDHAVAVSRKKNVEGQIRALKDLARKNASTLARYAREWAPLPEIGTDDRTRLDEIARLRDEVKGKNAIAQASDLQRKILQPEAAIKRWLRWVRLLRDSATASAEREALERELEELDAALQKSQAITNVIGLRQRISDLIDLQHDYPFLQEIRALRDRAKIAVRTQERRLQYRWNELAPKSQKLSKVRERIEALASEIDSDIRLVISLEKTISADPSSEETSRLKGEYTVARQRIFNNYELVIFELARVRPGFRDWRAPLFELGKKKARLIGAELSGLYGYVQLFYSGDVVKAAKTIATLNDPLANLAMSGVLLTALFRAWDALTQRSLAVLSPGIAEIRDSLRSATLSGETISAKLARESWDGRLELGVDDEPNYMKSFFDPNHYAAFCLENIVYEARKP